MAQDEGTLPPASGEVDTPMRVVVLSRRALLEGKGDVTLAADLADLLMAIDEPRRVTVLVDARHSPIELGFLARLSRDFPPHVAIVVQGQPEADRRAFHAAGVYRAQFEPDDGGVIVDGSAPLHRAVVLARVTAMLERSPTPLVSLRPVRR